MTDKHYTPSRMARQIVARLSLDRPSLVADFAAGEGALLDAALERWPSTRLIASDIDPGSVCALRERFVGLDADVCDFLEASQRARSGTLSQALGRVSLVFINPPFSCRGSARFEVELFGERLTCSRAMAFVVNSVRYLEPDGQLVALLPASCLTSEKDAAALDALSRVYQIGSLGGARPYEFADCSVHVSFVTLRPRIEPLNVIALQKSRETVSAITGPSFQAALLRGSVPVHAASATVRDEGNLYVHTTDLRGGSVGTAKRTAVSRSMIRGPAVMLPRVGQFEYEKICLYDGEEEVVMSDCIVALLCDSQVGTLALFNHLRENHEYIAQQYGGSCARYLTLQRLQGALRRIGVQVGVRRRWSVAPARKSGLDRGGTAAA